MNINLRNILLTKKTHEQITIFSQLNQKTRAKMLVNLLRVDQTLSARTFLARHSAPASQAILAVHPTAAQSALKTATALQIRLAFGNVAGTPVPKFVDWMLNAMLSITHPDVLVQRITMVTRTANASRYPKWSSRLSPRGLPILASPHPAAVMPTVNHLATERSAPVNQVSLETHSLLADLSVSWTVSAHPTRLASTRSVSIPVQGLVESTLSVTFTIISLFACVNKDS